MLATTRLDESQILELYQRFAKENRHKYDADAWQYIEENFWLYISDTCGPDILMQVYSELGIESPNGNFYKEHVRRIKELFDIKCNILDIASGMIPSFANSLAHEQLKLGKGTITLYEPLLISTEPKFANMTLHRKDFTSRTRIKDFDLITAIMPCEATETIITQACRNQKDFYIAMCGCTHSSTDYYGCYITPTIYQEQVIEKTKSLLTQYDNGTLVVERLDDNYDIDYPILYNRRK